MEAASGGYAEVGRVLLDKGADVNAPPVPSSRDTALTIAADKGHYKFCELLINRWVHFIFIYRTFCGPFHFSEPLQLIQLFYFIDILKYRFFPCYFIKDKR